MGTIAINNKHLEDFLERLLRWDELCRELREFYYRYLDLAAFRSEKCYFPGRRCVRSWNRKYGMGDLTLMWTYIANMAPLCDKIIKAISDVELEMKRYVLNSFEKNSLFKPKSVDGNIILSWTLKVPVVAYLVIWKDKLYAIFGEFEDVPKRGRVKSRVVERLAIEHALRCEQKPCTNVKIVDISGSEYERFWLEVPLSESASKILGGKDRAPVALFRNIGWLLSDDYRRDLMHGANNPGQIALRIYDWVALARYFERDAPLVFKLVSRQLNMTKEGLSVSVKVTPVGKTGRLIKRIYKLYGIKFGDKDAVFAYGYRLLQALREEAVKKEGNVYVVDEVGSWIAFSAVLTTLILGDGFVTPFTDIGISARDNASNKVAKRLAEAVGGVATVKRVSLLGWHVRLMLFGPPVPSFDKSELVYKFLVNYPVAATVKVKNAEFILYHQRNGKYVTGIKKAEPLVKLVKCLIGVDPKSNSLELKQKHLEELSEYGIPVRFMNELEKEMVKPYSVQAPPELETLRSVLEEVVKEAEIVVGIREGRKYIRIIPHDRSRVGDIAIKLRSANIRLSILKRRNIIYIYEARSVSAILEILKVFSKQTLLRNVPCCVQVMSDYTFLLYISFVKAVPTP